MGTTRSFRVDRARSENLEETLKAGLGTLGFEVSSRFSDRALSTRKLLVVPMTPLHSWENPAPASSTPQVWASQFPSRVRPCRAAHKASNHRACNQAAAARKPPAV